MRTCGLLVVPPSLFYLTTALTAPNSSAIAPHGSTPNQFAPPVKAALDASAHSLKAQRKTNPISQAKVEEIKRYLSTPGKSTSTLAQLKAQLDAAKEKLAEDNRKLAQLEGGQAQRPSTKSQASSKDVKFTSKHEEQKKAVYNRHSPPASSNIQPAAQAGGGRPRPPKLQPHLLPRRGSMIKRAEQAVKKLGTIAEEPSSEQTTKKGGPLWRIWNGVKNGGRRFKNKVKSGWQKLKAKFRRRK